MDRRLTVLFPINALNVGGAEQQLLELVKGLNKARFRPIVLALEAGGPLEQDFRAAPDVELITVKRGGKYDFLVLFRILRLLTRRRVDVVQPYLTPANLFGLLPAVLCRTPVKIMTRRPGTEKKEASMGYRLYFRAEAFLGRFVDWVVANSSAGKEYIAKKGVRQDRIKVFVNGVELRRLEESALPYEEARERLGLSPERRVIGTIARLVPFKNHAALLHAAVQIRREVPDITLCLVGDGPMRGSLERLAQELGLAQHVIFTGERRDIGAFLSAFDVAVLPSLDEGCSNFILEAMACGLPVVAMDLIGNRDLVQSEHTGLLVPSGDVEALAAAVIRMLRDTDAARAMAQRAREVAVEDFTVEAMVRKYERLYEETLARRGASREPTMPARPRLR